ncbi:MULTISPECIES: TetR/AcrR family transcriptional regulator [Pedobacter]|uniref:Regulatory protein TetR n=1 Tax=Pedobacter heparinus (strain ATCC 13125 / DSM 2366 / CIP 104194 / JCM 7457 / NBRC 12017 / NCIMB 9290 / NRRL B-14731 / HIM 762-3) TaxID=485917 RepID=C6XT28_PEDHD|nr:MULTISPECIES: TetR/AcrR family transcriptional regulator [Pedobacter]ACU03589.1 regulatory protein TetR [Pedobacter heparinus DSM 2366]MBB5436899.1 AcrR family transcriptional regulator [Pedobacter sp. AK017]
MGIAERKLRQKEEFRASILEAAWLQVLTDGWQSLSIRKIADAIEYSIPVIYNHFENKEAILLEFTKAGFQKLADALQKVKIQHKDPALQLEAIANAYWDFAFDHKEYYQLMFGLGIPACDRINQVAELKNMTTIMISSIQEAIAASTNKEADFFLKYHTYFSILHGLVSIQMIEKDGKPAEENRRILQDAISGFIKSLF